MLFLISSMSLTCLLSIEISSPIILRCLNLSSVSRRSLSTSALFAAIRRKMPIKIASSETHRVRLSILKSKTNQKPNQRVWKTTAHQLPRKVAIKPVNFAATGFCFLCSSSGIGFSISQKGKQVKSPKQSATPTELSRALCKGGGLAFLHSLIGRSPHPPPIKGISNTGGCEPPAGALGRAPQLVRPPADAGMITVGRLLEDSAVGPSKSRDRTDRTKRINTILFIVSSPRFGGDSPRRYVFQRAARGATTSLVSK